MKKLSKLVISLVIPAFFMAQISFSFLVMLSDLFGHINTYISQRAPIDFILKNTLLYLPMAIYFSLPTSVLFATSFAMGTLYSQNELIAVFGSGVSLKQFVKPIIYLGIGLSIFFFIFTETIVIPSLKARSQTSQQNAGSESQNNTDVTLISEKGKIIYNAALYDDNTKTLSNLMVIYRNPQAKIVKRVDSLQGTWNNNYWVLSKARIFELDSKELNFRETYQETYEDVLLLEKPETFRRSTIKAGESNIFELHKAFSSLKSAGLPYRDLEVEFFRRFSFSLAPIGVVLLASVVGGRYKKNIILLCLASSLGISIIYFAVQMIGEVLAKSGVIPTFIGTFLGIVLTLALSFLAFKRVRN